MTAKIAIAFAAVSVLSSPLSAQGFSYAELTQNGEIAFEHEPIAQSGKLYEAGSISKFACTLAILRLADRGSLTLDDPIGWYIPQLGDAPAASIALRDVLANRSGIRERLMPALRANAAGVMAIPDAATAATEFAAGELDAEPGSMWSYDLINWIVVQAVIERVAGQSVAGALNALVLEPSGMGTSRVSSSIDPEAVVPPAEVGRPLPAFLQCAGGLATRPADLLALARFPHKGGLSGESLQELTKVTTFDQSYTLGGRYRILEGGDMVSWQTGSNGAYKSLVVYNPETDRGFAAMTASGQNAPIQQARAVWLESTTEL